MAAATGESHEGSSAFQLLANVGRSFPEELVEPGAEPPDSAEEREYAELQRQRREHVVEVLADLLNGSHAWNFFCRAGWLLSHSTVFGGIYMLPDLAVERKGFLTIGLLYSTSATMQLTKFIRDRGEANRTERAVEAKLLPAFAAMGTIHALRGTREWQMACIGSWLAAVGASFFGIMRMPLKAHQRLFLVMGLCCSVSSTITLSKQIRDQEDGLKWRSLASKTA
jgi:hypothetical protein